jgi:type I restriction enzyme R subunit
VTFDDTALERDYLFAKALQVFVRADAGAGVDLSGAVELTHLRHEQRFAGSVALDADSGEVTTIYSGTGRMSEPDAEPLSAIINRLNAQYGTDWGDADRLVFDAALDDLVASEEVQVTAVNNTPENSAWSSPSCSSRPCWHGWTATRRWCSSSSTTPSWPPTW